MMRTRAAALAATITLAAVLGQGVSTARAADADASAIAFGSDSSRVYVAGSAQFPNELRSGVAGRWSEARGRFDWLERVDASPGGADALTAIVPLGDFVYGIGSANGELAVAKLDAATGRLRRSCGPTGIRLSSLGPSVLPGRAAVVGGDIVVVGGTLVQPTRGVIAEIDPASCAVVRSALVAASDPTVSAGFTSVDPDASGDLVVSGFSGGNATIFRFDRSMIPRGTQTFDLGGTTGSFFSDVKAGTDRGVAVALVGSQLLAQCFTLPALAPDTRCGTDGRRSLSFDSRGVPAIGATLGRLPSGSWLVAGSHAGTAGFATSQFRPALGAFEPVALAADTHVLAPAGTQVFDPFPALPATFTAVTASSSGIAGVGDAGFVGSRRPFLFSSQLDGTTPTFTSLTGLDTAAPAPVEPAPPAPPPSPVPAVLPAAQPAPGTPPPVPPAPSLANARFAQLTRRPAADGTFGFLTLTCRHACTARGTYTARLPGTGTARLGRTTARLAARWRLRVRLTLTRQGLRTLARAKRLDVTVRFVVADRTGAQQLVGKTVTLRARHAS
jgi:hypothetical protein